VAGEEFEINTEGAGQHWTVVLSDNGTPFFTNERDVRARRPARHRRGHPTARSPWGRDSPGW